MADGKPELPAPPLGTWSVTFTALHRADPRRKSRARRSPAHHAGSRERCDHCARICAAFSNPPGIPPRPGAEHRPRMLFIPATPASKPSHLRTAAGITSDFCHGYLLYVISNDNIV